MSMMFQNCSGLGDISNLDVSRVTNMSYMFSLFMISTTSIPDISSWDVSSVTNMSYMFYSKFFSTTLIPDISGWNVSSVTGMLNMFHNRTSFNQDLKSWNPVTSLICKPFGFDADTFAWLPINKPSFKSPPCP
jgi:surface protein